MDTSADVVIVDKLGASVKFIRLPGADLGDWPLISEFTYMSSIAAVTALAFVVAVCRTVLCFQQHGRLDLDDAIFILAVVATIASSVFNISVMDFFYVEVQVASGALMYANVEDIIPGTIRYLQVMNIVTALQWISIFGVKTCYLIFFRKLTSRVPAMRIWWWVVLGITIPCFIINASIGPFICAEFNDDILTKCTLDGMYHRSVIFNIITGSLDIFTDVLSKTSSALKSITSLPVAVISIPILLISRLQINPRRKLAIISILCLSSAMIAVSFIRLFPPPEKVIDTVWFFYWISFEAAIAIIMVSITGFRGIFGVVSQRGSSGRRTPSYFAKKLATVSSRMGRFFIWNSHASQTEITEMTEATERSGSIQRKHSPHSRGFFFKWTTRADSTLDSIIDIDRITSITALHSHPVAINTPQPPKPAKKRSIDRPIEISGISIPSASLSPLSTQNPTVSPLSSYVGTAASRGHDRDSYNVPLAYSYFPGHHSSSPARGTRLVSDAASPSTAHRPIFGGPSMAQVSWEHRAREWSRSGQLSPDPEAQIELKPITKEDERHRIEPEPQSPRRGWTLERGWW